VTLTLADRNRLRTIYSPKPHRSVPEAHLRAGVTFANRHFFSPPALSSAPSCVTATFLHEYRAQTIHHPELHRPEPEARLRCRFYTVVAALVIPARGSCRADTECAAAGNDPRSRRIDGRKKERTGSGFEVVI
jgi:hypothetical protein